ncbi:cytochrome P450 71A1-like protein [Tanacetum coccineum]
MGEAFFRVRITEARFEDENNQAIDTNVGDQEDPSVKDKQEADDDTNIDDFGYSLPHHKGADLIVKEVVLENIKSDLEKDGDEQGKKENKRVITFFEVGANKDSNPNGVFNDVGGVRYSKADDTWVPARRIEDGWHLFDELGSKPNIMKEDMVDILPKLKHHPDSSVSLTFDHIKDVLMNILLGGTNTSVATVVWAMVLLMKNPKSLKKLQQKVRNVIGNKGKVHKDDLDKLKYLKAVIKEPLRLYLVIPLLVPQEGRDPNCWKRPGEFEPERFMGNGSSIDYKETGELILFGSGYKMEMTLSNLIYSFDVESPVKAQEIDTLKSPGNVTHKKNALQLMAKIYDHHHKT